MSYAIQFLPAARKALARLPQPIQVRIDQHILALAERPRPHGAIPLKGEGKGLWRLRVGDYRVLYLIQDQKLIVVVIDIGNRREVYRHL